MPAPLRAALSPALDTPTPCAPLPAPALTQRCRRSPPTSPCRPLQVKEAMFAYGKHLGLAFQVVDDILDFTQSTEQLGKPQGQDLASGNLTAPAIFALQVRQGRPRPRLARRLPALPCPALPACRH
jgi:hypothetical protein